MDLSFPLLACAALFISSTPATRLLETYYIWMISDAQTHGSHLENFHSTDIGRASYHQIQFIPDVCCVTTKWIDCCKSRCNKWNFKVVHSNRFVIKTSKYLLQPFSLAQHSVFAYRKPRETKKKKRTYFIGCNCRWCLFAFDFVFFFSRFYLTG